MEKIKYILIVLGLVFIIGILSLISSTDSGVTSPGAAANIVRAGDTGDWDDPGNITASDDNSSSTSLSLAGAGSSDYLEVDDFGFSIPDGAIINGILVEIEKQKGSSKTVDETIQLLKGNVITGDNKADTSTDWPVSDAYVSYGGSEDLWGTTWTSTEINNGGFGVDVAAQLGEASSCNGITIDHVRITVYYTEASLPSNKISFGSNGHLKIGGTNSRISFTE